MVGIGGRGRARVGICVGVPTRCWAVFVACVLTFRLFFCSLQISPVSISCSYLSQMLLFVYLLDFWVFATYCFGPLFLLQVPPQCTFTDYESSLTLGQQQPLLMALLLISFSWHYSHFLQHKFQRIGLPSVGHTYSPSTSFI